ncbi:hypothetical protein MMC24_002246 [Lignoscripta atroalba]|nr:hypothetical protein [Lignoscripta atroalba]
MVVINSHYQVAPLTVSIVFTIVATLAVVLRVYSRRVTKKPLEDNDYFIFIALVLLYGLVACDMVGILAGGVGRHVLDVMKEDGPQTLTIFLKDLVAIQILWATSLMSIKISILMFYMRIFKVQSFRVAARITMVLVVLWALSVILCGFLLCKPFAFNWNQTIPGGSCKNQILSYILTGALNIITDVMVLSLPIPMVWKLQTPRANKIVLTGIFGLGFFFLASLPSSICIISIVRLITLVGVSYTDITYSVVDALIWSMLEPALGITLACLPVMRPLLPKTFPGRSEKRSKDSSNSGRAAKAFYAKNFRQIDDQEYPLRPVGPVDTATNQTLVEGHSDPYNKSMRHHVDDVESQQGSQNEATEPGGPLSEINVKKEWDIRRS